MAEPSSDRRLVAKEEERDHLIASLDDLDAEFQAGDLDEDDYRTLRADYTTRAASAIRAIEQRRLESTSPARSWSRIALWTAGIVVVAAFAGVWLADFSGSRLAGETISGDIRTSVRTRLFQAGEATQQQEFEQALELYDSVLVDDPSNAEALAYRGWLTRLQDGPEPARDYVEEAVAADPDYPDARVFAASIALQLGEPLVAEGHLRTLDTLDSAPYIQQLVSQMGLRSEIEAAASAAAASRVVPVMLDDGIGFADSGFTVHEVVLAAEHLAASDRLDEGLDLFTAMLDDAPEDRDVRVALGWYVGRASVGIPEGLATAASHLGAVIDADPARADALVYRAFVRLAQDDAAGAAADLADYDALDVVRHDLDLLIAETGLRDAVA